MVETQGRPTVIFDIDGTLADVRHRRAFLEQSPPDWKSFHAAMGDDTPNANIVLLYQTLWESGRFDLILVSGRHESSRALTEQWLIWNGMEFGRLLMRRDGDSRADHLIKEELLDQLLAEGRTIAFTVDDRQQVVDMWRRRGLTCLQCDVGDF